MKEKAVLLIHGLGGSPTELSHLKKILQEKGFDVYLPVLPGHGTNFNDLKKIKYKDLINFVENELINIKQEYETVCVSGLCLGAVLSLYLGEFHSDKVTAISPISTTLYYDGWGLPKLSRLMPLFRYTPFYYFYNLPEEEPYGIKDERIRKFIVSKMSNDSSVHYSKIPFKSFWQMHLLNKFVISNLYRIKNPLLVIHPRQDDVSSLKSVEIIEKSIEKRKIKKIILEDSYHLATLDRERELVSNSIANFFEFEISKKRGIYELQN